ncbi:Nonribosomal peptide synthase [Raoultella planticola]|uniref:Nonribosomal peptide synthase n=1 Tax=Raoultella planticola TaxID=575 RepID=A0A485CTG9_RAOPL|nr:Nonribosomal peptide synthase [Raoultella planticola]
MSWAACADHNVNRWMPVVFTSMLGMTLEGMTIDQAMSHLFGEPCYVFTQTPQVWLDHQVMESDAS